MTALKLAAGLSDLAGGYDALLCDVWGVIHNGRESFPAACAALARYRAEVGPVILISNSPRPHGPVIEQLDGLGVPRDAYSAIVTSGDATRLLLAERAPGPAWKIGPDRDDALYDGLGVEFTGLADAAFISVTGPYDDETEEPGDYRDRFMVGVARDLELICANPDIVVQRGDKLIYCGGALAKLYESLGGRVTMAGKPYPAIYQLSLAKAAEALGSLPVDLRPGALRGRWPAHRHPRRQRPRPGRAVRSERHPRGRNHRPRRPECRRRRGPDAPGRPDHDLRHPRSCLVRPSLVMAPNRG